MYFIFNGVYGGFLLSFQSSRILIKFNYLRLFVFNLKNDQIFRNI